MDVRGHAHGRAMCSVCQGHPRVDMAEARLQEALKPDLEGGLLGRTVGHCQAGTKNQCWTLGDIQGGQGRPV
jgi:hypothetical protein